MARPVSTVWIIGLGTTGSALAALFAHAGLHVVGVEADPAGLAHGRTRVHQRLGELAGPAGLTAGQAKQARDRVDYTLRLEAIWAAADLVIEAVPERLDLKVEVLSRAHAVCAPETVFATTTAGLSVTEVASRSGRMTRTVGLHLPHNRSLPASRVLEVVCTPVTEAQVREQVHGLVRLLERTPVTGGDHPGSVGSALMLAYLNRAAIMYEQGYASRDDIDAAMTLGCGLPSGPLAHLDEMGLDVACDGLTGLYQRSGDPRYSPAPVLARMVAAGLLGRKSGQGFYAYSSGEADELAVDLAVPGPGSHSGLQPAALPDGLPVQRIGVVGAGTMAVGIAEVCARAGYPTVLVARSELRAKEALTAVERSLARGVERGKLTAAELDATTGRLSCVSEMDELATCDLVIEAVAEDLDTKRAIFTELDNRTRPSAVLATATSSLPVIKCATATSRPENVIGMHFFNPAPVMRLVEVSHTFLTSEQVLATAHRLAASLGKHTVRCGDRAGFIVNALLFPYLNHAIHLAQERHLAFSCIDEVITGGYGYPLGPFQLMDVIGLDVSLAIQDSLYEAFTEPVLLPGRYLTDLVEAGYLGRKTGRGFHLHATR